MTECKILFDRLQSGETDLIREACFEAGDTKCEDAVPIVAELLKSSNLGVQEAAEQALRKIGGASTVQAVIPLLRSEDAPARNLAMDILRAVGNQDLNSLIGLLHDQDPDIRIFIADILGSSDSEMSVEPLCGALLKDPEVNVRYQAAVSLGDLAMPSAAQCLNKAMDDDEWVQYAVIEALAKIKHSSSVGALVKALNKSSDLVASMIVDALGEMGNVQAVTMLLRKLDDVPTALRNKIVKAIVSILGGKSLTLLTKEEREKVRDYMLVALEDEDEDVQDAAIRGLAFVGGEKASDRVLTLASALDPDRDHDRLEKAVESLENIGLTKALESGLNSGQPPLAKIAVEILSRLSGPEVSQVLIDSFPGKDRDLQRLIVTALSSVAHEEAREFFMDVLHNQKDGTVLKAAMGYLGNKMHFAEAQDLLFEMLDHEWDDVKEAALEACVAVGGPEMSRRFHDMAGDADPIKRLMAVYAIGELGDKSNLDILKNALEDEIPDIRKVALEAVSHMVPNSSECLSLITPRLYDENRDVRLTLAELMGHRYRDDMIPYLIQFLDDDDDWVKIRAIDALGTHKEESAVPKLVGMLEHSSKLVAMKVIGALGEIGGTRAFRSLLGVGDLGDEELAWAVQEAIAKIQAENEEES